MKISGHSMNSGWRRGQRNVGATSAGKSTAFVGADSCPRSAFRRILPPFVTNLAATILLLLLAVPLFAASVDEFIADAKKQITQKDYRAAIIQLKNALQKDPDNRDARLLLGTTYLEIGDPVSAEKELRRARSLGAADVDWMVPLANAYLQIGRANDLLSEIPDKKDLPPDVRAEILAIRGDANAVLNQLEKAKAAYEDAIKADPNIPAGHVGMARYALATKNVEAAKLSIEKAMAVDKRYAPAWLLKAEIARHEQDREGAETAYKTALEIEPGHINAKLGLASIYIAKRNIDDAQPLIDDVIKRAPLHPMANYFSAVISFSKKDVDEARSALEKVLASTKDHVPSLYLLGMIQYQSGNLEQAEKHLSRFNKALPAHIQGAKMLAATRIKQKNYKEAIAVLKPWENDENADVQLLGLLGSAYMRAGENVKATHYLERAAEIDPNEASIRTQLGLGYLAGGNVEQGLATLEAASDLDKEIGQADILLIAAHLRNQEFAQAVQAANELVKKKPDDPVSYNFRGVAYLGDKDEAKARDDFNKSLQLDKQFTPARINLAKMAVGKGKLDEAKQELNKVLEYDKDNEQALISLARIAAQEKDNSSVNRWLSRAQKSNPESVKAATVMARYYLTQNEPLKALEVLRPAINKHPKDPVLIETQATTYMQNNDYASAVAQLNLLLKDFPDSARVHVGLARALVGNKQTTKAVEHLNKAIKAQPDYLTAYVALAELQLKEKNYKESGAVAARVQSQFADIPAGWIIEGDSLMAQGQYTKAISAYETAQQKRTTSTGTMKLAQAYKQDKQAEKAIDVLEKWVSKNKIDANASMMLAMELQNVKRDDDAIKYYESVIEQNPDNVAALNNLAWIYAEKEDKRGVEYGQKAFELAAQSPAVMDTYGWALVKAGNVQKGINLIKEASVKAPHILEIQYHLAYGYYVKGDTARAKSELTRLLEEQDFANKKEANALLARMK